MAKVIDNIFVRGLSGQVGGQFVIRRLRDGRTILCKGPDFSSRKLSMGIIAMKVYFRGFASRIPGFTGMEPFFRFALFQPVTTAVIGCDDIRQLEENVAFASSYTAMSQKEQDELLEFVAPYARQLMYYKP